MDFAKHASVNKGLHNLNKKLVHFKKVGKILHVQPEYKVKNRKKTFGRVQQRSNTGAIRAASTRFQALISFLAADEFSAAREKKSNNYISSNSHNYESEYITVMQRFRVVYHGISHESFEYTERIQVARKILHGRLRESVA